MRGVPTIFEFWAALTPSSRRPQALLSSHRRLEGNPLDFDVEECIPERTWERLLAQGAEQYKAELIRVFR